MNLDETIAYDVEEELEGVDGMKELFADPIEKTTSKPRGRPRKHTQVEQPVQPDTSNTGDAEEEREGVDGMKELVPDSVEKATPKPRGRPRKNIQVEQSQPEINNTEETSTHEQTRNAGPVDQVTVTQVTTPQVDDPVTSEPLSSPVPIAKRSLKKAYIRKKGSNEKIMLNFRPTLPHVPLII